MTLHNNLSSSNNQYSLAVVAAKKAPPAQANAPIDVVVKEEDTDTVQFSNHQPTQAYKNASNLTEALLSHTQVDMASLREESASADPAISQKAGSTLAAIRTQYSGYYEQHSDADGFIYVAGQGMVAYSADGAKYPKQEEVQEQADKALTQYLQASQIPSADSLLKARQATGKPLSETEQAEVAQLLKEEAKNMKPSEVAQIKSQLSPEHTGLIPDYPEHEALKTNVTALVQDLSRVSKSGVDQAWLTAVYGENTPDKLSSLEQDLRGRASQGSLAVRANENRQAGRTVMYSAEQEEEFALT